MEPELWVVGYPAPPLQREYKLSDLHEYGLRNITRASSCTFPKHTGSLAVLQETAVCPFNFPIVS